jgi:hypothetical protein
LGNYSFYIASGANYALQFYGSGLAARIETDQIAGGVSPNPVFNSVKTNGNGPNAIGSGDNASFTPTTGTWWLASIAGVNHLFDISGNDYGRVLGTNACGVQSNGSIVGLPCLNGSGLIPTGQLGTGTPSTSTFLRGDNTWATPAAGGGATPSCQLIASSDTLTSAGPFATTCTPSLTLSVGSVIEVVAHGTYTTTGTASPQIQLQVNAGGTAGLCSSGGNINPGLNKTNGPWQLVCYIQIATTGAPGTAQPWGQEWLANPNGGATIGPVLWQPACATTCNYTTTSNQTFSIQETGTFVAGQTITLQSFFVRQY